MSINLTFLTMKDYETVPIFLRRVLYETGTLSYTLISISNEMAGGVKVIHLSSNRTLKDQLKIEVPSSLVFDLITELKGTRKSKTKNVIKEDVKDETNKYGFSGLRDYTGE
jgi:hypothetical protein